MSARQNSRIDCVDLAECAQYSDRHVKLTLEHFADRMDQRIQTEMFAELMTRYADVSAQLEATNHKLADSDATRLEAQRIAMLGNWRYDLRTRELTWSETMYSILELPTELTPTINAFLNVMNEQDRANINDAVADVESGKPPQPLQYRLQMPDGRVKWVRANHLPLIGADGTVTAIYGTLQDITSAKTAEIALQNYNDRLEELVQEKVQEVFSSQMATIYALVKLAESRDDDTGEHIERMTRYCGLIARKLQENSPYAAQVDDDFVRNITMASPLHDIGKVGVPDSILLKPGRLTAEEFAIMKTHVTVGYETLASVVTNYPGNAYLKMGMDIARYHHEKWDGSGYQEGLSGEDIPLSARILTLCDVYDALRSRRVYKEAFPHEQSMEIMLAGRGTHFDPVLTDVLEANQAEMRKIFEERLR